MVSLLAAPILTRLYAPEAFGVFALFGSITGVLGAVVCLRYEMAIMLPECDEEAANLLSVSLGFALLISLTMIPFVWWGRETISQWLNAPALSNYLWLAPLAILVSGIFLALNYWNSRTRHFGRLAIARVTNSLTTTPLMLGLGFVGYATGGSMIGSSIAGQAVATGVLGSQTWRDDRKIFLKAVHFRPMWDTIKQHKKFPLLSTWTTLMNAVSLQIMPLLLAFFFSSAVVGFYALGHRLLSMPMSLIGSAIAQVFFQRSATAKYDGTLPLVVGNTLTRLMALGLFPILMVMVTGKDIFSVVFGVQWAEAGLYAQILAPWIMFQFISSPISTLFSVLEMQGSDLLFNSALLGTRIVALMIGGFLNSITMALILFSITGAIMYCCLCLFLLKKAGTTLKLLTHDILKILLIAFISLLPVVLLEGYGVQPMTATIASCLCILLYYTILYLSDKELQKLMSRFFIRHH